MIRLVCPHCGTERDLEPRWLGHRTVCLGCRKPVTVRTESESNGAAASAAAEGRPRPPTTAVPAPAAKKLKVNCPSCSRRYEFHEDCVGVSVHCFRCGAHFTILTAAGEVLEGELPADPEPAAGPARPVLERLRETLHTPLGRVPKALASRLRRRLREPEPEAGPDAPADTDPGAGPDSAA